MMKTFRRCMVVLNLGDQSRQRWYPRLLQAVIPAAWAARSASGESRRPFQALELRRQRHAVHPLEARREPHVVERPRLVARALPAKVGSVDALRDHTVEPRPALRKPLFGYIGVMREW